MHQRDLVRSMAEKPGAVPCRQWHMVVGVTIVEEQHTTCSIRHGRELLGHRLQLGFWSWESRRDSLSALYPMQKWYDLPWYGYACTNYFNITLIKDILGMHVEMDTIISTEREYGGRKYDMIRVRIAKRTTCVYPYVWYHIHGIRIQKHPLWYCMSLTP